MEKVIKYMRMLIKNPYDLWLSILQKCFGIRSFYKSLARAGIIKYDRATSTYVREINGNKFHLNPLDPGLSRVLARDGMREKESVDALHRYVNPDMNILDIGANIGFYVILESQIISKGNGKGKIIAIEPSPDNFKILSLNIDANNYNNYVAKFEGAISNYSGSGKLVKTDAGNQNFLSEVYGGASSKRDIDVPVFTMKEFLKHAQTDIEQIDFLRMDTEGAEYRILPTIYDFLDAKNEFLMFIEFHPHVDRQLHKEVLKKLESMGYRVLDATKEYSENNRVMRSHKPDTSIRQLYTEDFFMTFGGCEVFLKKGK